MVREKEREGERSVYKVINYSIIHNYCNITINIKRSSLEIIKLTSNPRYIDLYIHIYMVYAILQMTFK